MHILVDLNFYRAKNSVLFQNLQISGMVVSGDGANNTITQASWDLYDPATDLCLFLKPSYPLLQFRWLAEQSLVGQLKPVND